MMKPEDLEDFTTLGSATGTKKGNKLMKAVRELLTEAQKNKKSPRNLYLNTDSVPVVLQVDGLFIESYSSGENPDL